MQSQFADAPAIEVANIAQFESKQLQGEVVDQGFCHPLRIRHPIERLACGKEVLFLHKPACCQVHLDVGPEVVMKHLPTLVVPRLVDDSVPASQQASDVIVSPNVEDQVFRTMVGALFADHPPVGLINSKASHAEISDRLAQMSRQILLPGLTVADLVAMSEAVSVGIDAAFFSRIDKRSPRSIELNRR